MDELENVGFDLIAVQRAVLGTRRLVGIRDDQAGLFELVKSKPANGLASVWGPVFLVVFRDELHDGSYALEGFSCFVPRFLGRQINKRKQSEGGSLILLFFGQPEGDQDLLSFCDATLLNASFHCA